MRVTNFVLGTITAAALLGATACGTPTVSVRPASDGTGSPTSSACAKDATCATSSRSTAAAATSESAAVDIGKDGTTITDGNGAKVSIGSGGVSVTDGSGNSVVAGPGGVDVTGNTSGTDQSDTATDPASNPVVFCGQATRFGTANSNLSEALRTRDSNASDTFARSVAIMTDAVVQMRRSGPPSINPDLDILGAATAEFGAEFERNGRDITRLVDAGTLDGIASASGTAFVKVNAATVRICH